jgi:Fe-S-cluster containining protein
MLRQLIKGSKEEELTSAQESVKEDLHPKVALLYEEACKFVTHVYKNWDKNGFVRLSVYKKHLFANKMPATAIFVWTRLFRDACLTNRVKDPFWLNKEINRCTGNCCTSFTLPVAPESFQRELLEEEKKHSLVTVKGQNNDHFKLQQETVAKLKENLVHQGLGDNEHTYDENALWLLRDQGAYEEGEKHKYTCKLLDKNCNCSDYENRFDFCRSFPKGIICPYKGCERLTVAHYVIHMLWEALEFHYEVENPFQFLTCGLLQWTCSKQQEGEKEFWNKMYNYLHPLDQFVEQHKHKLSANKNKPEQAIDPQYKSIFEKGKKPVLKENDEVQELIKKVKNETKEFEGLINDFSQKVEEAKTDMATGLCYSYEWFTSLPEKEQKFLKDLASREYGAAKLHLDTLDYYKRKGQ